MMSNLEIIKYKYLKYKTKYIQLSELIGGNYSIDYIHNLFTTSKLYELDETRQYNKPVIEPVFTTPRKSERLVNKAPPDYTFLPDILINQTPITGKRLKIDMGKDDVIHANKELIEEINDETYIYYEENYGKLIETFYIDNCECPVCHQKTLRRYVRSNFPLIDAVCIYPNHTYNDGVKYFQIKSSNGSLFRGKKYFSKKDRFSHTGGSKLAILAHSIKTNSRKKYTLFGYICIEYIDNDNELIVNKKKSFIILPNISFSHPKMFYYRYNPYLNTVFFNKSPNIIVAISDIKTIPKLYNKYYNKININI